MRVTKVSTQRQCAVCERSLLLGERSVRFAPEEGAELVHVCPLCQETAIEHGWIKEGTPSIPTVVGERKRRRRGLVESLWAADGSYTDPLADANGRAEIDGLIGAVQQQFPDFVFTIGGPVDAHHGQARFSWHLGPSGAEPIVIGFDVAVLNGGGQIRSVYGFLDKVPAA